MQVVSIGVTDLDKSVGESNTSVMPLGPLIAIQHKILCSYSISLFVFAHVSVSLLVPQTPRVLEQAVRDADIL